MDERLRPYPITPYSNDVAASGPTAPKCDRIDDLIRLLVTIRHRFGNTAVKYRVAWGGSEHWCADELHKEIDRLKAENETLSAQNGGRDDDEPVTPNWVGSLGLLDVLNSNYRLDVTHDGWVHLTERDDESDVDHCLAPFLAKVETRGQVRHLLSALGIPTPESKDKGDGLT